MGASWQELILGDSYFRITILGSFFWIYGLAGNMIVRAEGRMKMAAVMMGAGLLVDVAAKYLLVVIFPLGVEGAAWASNIGMLAYTVIGWFYFGRGRASFRSKLISIRWDKEIGTSIIFMAMTLFPSIDKGKPAALIGIARQLVFYVPVMLLVPIWLGVAGIYYGSFAIDAVIVIWTMLMVKKEFHSLRQRNA